MPSKQFLKVETAEQREKRLAYNRAYNQANSERINRLNREYQKNNPKWEEYRNKKIICECGAETSQHNKWIHVKSARHLSSLTKQQTVLTN